MLNANFMARISRDCLGTLALLAMVSGPLAKEAEQESDAPKEQQGVSQPTYETLTKARKLLDQNHYAEALGVLQDLLPKVKDNAYEAALTQQALAYVHLARKDYPKAIVAIEAALAKESLPGEVCHSLYYNLAQVYIQTEEYGRGLKALDQWLAKEKNPPADAYYLAAIAHHRLKRPDAAISALKRAIAKAGKPREDWDQFLLALYFESQRYAEAIPVLKTLLVAHPHNKDYWHYLTDVQLQLKHESEALATLKQAYRLVALSEADLIRLAQLNLRANIPFSAARLLEREMADGRIRKTAAHLELLGNSWAMAREPKRAVTALEQAAAHTRKGKIHLEIAHMHLGMEHWVEAAHSLEKALARGGLNDPAYANLLLGFACYHQGDSARARAVSALKQAANSKRHRTQAQRLLGQVQKPKGIAAAQE
ncbi:MAG: tetratricopeptide repeat protein [Gammaproteobacteria bacterium]